ncbi:MAG: hypothetical protein ABSE49_16555 [Polyangiaceae bacterium]|jgi:hypothetical protein
MACVRPARFLLALALSSAAACSSTSSTSPTLADDYDDAAVIEGDANVDEAGSVEACMNAGGTCQTFDMECPVLQQNTALCGDSVMICCLPPDDAAPYLPPLEAGPETGAPMPEAGPVEASSPSDAGGG